VITIDANTGKFTVTIGGGQLGPFDTREEAERAERAALVKRNMQSPRRRGNSRWRGH